MKTKTEKFDNLKTSLKTLLEKNKQKDHRKKTSEEEIEIHCQIIELINLWDHRSTESPGQKMVIEFRISEMLPEVFDVHGLIDCYNQLPSDFPREKDMRFRIFELLSKIFDIYELNECYNQVASDSPLEKLIESQIQEALRRISNMYELITYWKNIHFSPIRKLIEARIQEALRKIFNLFLITNYHQFVIADFRLRTLIETRAIELINSVNTENVNSFEWFETFTKEFNFLPEFLQKPFKQKAQEIYNKINSQS